MNFAVDTGFPCRHHRRGRRPRGLRPTIRATGPLRGRLLRRDQRPHNGWRSVAHIGCGHDRGRGERLHPRPARQAQRLRLRSRVRSALRERDHSGRQGQGRGALCDGHPGAVRHRCGSCRGRRTERRALGSVGPTASDQPASSPGGRRTAGRPRVPTVRHTGRSGTHGNGPGNTTRHPTPHGGVVLRQSRPPRPSYWSRAFLGRNTRSAEGRGDVRRTTARAVRFGASFETGPLSMTVGRGGWCGCWCRPLCPPQGGGGDCHYLTSQVWASFAESQYHCMS